MAFYYQQKLLWYSDITLHIWWKVYNFILNYLKWKNNIGRWLISRMLSVIYRSLYVVHYRYMHLDENLIWKIEERNRKQDDNVLSQFLQACYLTVTWWSSLIVLSKDQMLWLFIFVFSWTIDGFLKGGMKMILQFIALWNWIFESFTTVWVAHLSSYHCCAIRWQT